MRTIPFVAGFATILVAGGVLLRAGPPPEPERHDGNVVFVGDSLANNMTVVVNHLTGGRERPRVTGIVKPGMQVADTLVHAARALETGASGVLVEVNVFPFNERRHRGAEVQDQLVTRTDKTLYEVWQLGRPGVWYDLVQQDGIDPLLANALTNYPPFPWGATRREQLREKVSASIAERFDGTRLDADKVQEFGALRRAEMSAANLRVKNLGAGVDTRMLGELLRYLAVHAGDAHVGLLFPPLNRSYFQSQQPGLWEDVLDWVKLWSERASAEGIEIVDHTSLFADEPEHFQDYGHTASIERLGAWAMVLLDDLERMGWITR